MRAHKPGEISKISGQYKMISLITGKSLPHERTIVRGEPFPPTIRKRQGFILVDKTKK